MSSTNHIPLTENQEEFLKALEEEFKDRYTENDEEFKKIMNEKPSLPPVLRTTYEPRNRYRNYPEDRHYGRHRGDDEYYGRRRGDDEYYGRRRDDDRHQGGHSRSSHSSYRTRDFRSPYSRP